MEVHEGVAAALACQFDHWDKAESLYEVDYEFDADVSHGQFVVFALDGQFKLLVHDLGGDYFLEGIALEIEQIAQSHIMHFFVSLGNDGVEFSADELAASYVDDAAEAAADCVDDQLAACVIVYLDEGVGSAHLTQCLQVLLRVVDKTVLLTTHHSPYRKGFAWVILEDIDFLQ